MDSFQSKVTALSSSTLDKVHQVLNFRCIVGGGEQNFLLSLGVSPEAPLCHCLVTHWSLLTMFSLLCCWPTHRVVRVVQGQGEVEGQAEIR